MADPQPARGRAQSDHLSTNDWMDWRRIALGIKQKLDQSALAKNIAGWVATEVSRPQGVAEGAIDSATSLFHAAPFLSKVFDPLDIVINRPENTAAAKFYNAGRTAGQYAVEVRRDPSKLQRDVKTAASNYRKSTDPTATPVAPTLAEEIQRSRNIGRNQGKTQFAIGSLAYGTPALKGLTAFPRAAEELAAADRLVASVTPVQAARLTGEYSGRYHHFVPLRLTKPFPQVVRDNPFFVYQPQGLSQIEYYRRHFKLDPSFNGGPLPEGGSWSGKDLGWTKFGLFDRHSFGMPGPLRAAVLSNAGSSLGSAYTLPEDEDVP
jgi:hypothetical protein